MGWGCVGAPPRCERERAHFCIRESIFAPGAGAPTDGVGVCRSTAPGANGASTFSHPGRVLLRRGDALRGTSTGSPAMRGAAHRRYAICTRNVAVSYV